MAGIYSNCSTLETNNKWKVIRWHDTHTRLMALFPRLPGWVGTKKVKPIWILLKQDTVSASGTSWAIYKSAPSSRQITTPAPHHSVFYRPDALPAAQRTASKHWRHDDMRHTKNVNSTNYLRSCSMCSFSCSKSFSQRFAFASTDWFFFFSSSNDLFRP